MWLDLEDCSMRSMRGGLLFGPGFCIMAVALQMSPCLSVTARDIPSGVGMENESYGFSAYLYA